MSFPNGGTSGKSDTNNSKRSSLTLLGVPETTQFLQVFEFFRKMLWGKEMFQIDTISNHRVKANLP